MFDPDPVRNDPSRTITRRLFLWTGGAAVAGIGLVTLHDPPGVEASRAVHGTPGEVAIASFANDGSLLGVATVAKIVKSDGVWACQLGSNAFGIARTADTEMPFSSPLLREHRAGVFRCLCCATALFASTTKFDSHTGWPSFWQSIARQNLVERPDLSLGVERTEMRCTRCESHLGHVFNDGPEPTGLRFCANGASLQFSAA
jgi:peptide-methionine (R)-S-oxide reductase